MFCDIEACRLCRLGDTCNRVVTMDYRRFEGDLKGESDPFILFVGEAPGADEDREGIPFVGRSGKLLREAIFLAHLKSHGITNIVKCRPPNNRAPTKMEIATCNGYLWNEINATDPGLIVALGATACSFFQGFAVSQDVHIMSYRDLRRLRVFHILEPYTKQEFLVFATYHPSYVLRGGLTREEYISIFKLAREMIPGIMGG